jgi:hypothetical protein
MLCVPCELSCTRYKGQLLIRKIGKKGSHRQSLLILAANPGVLEGDSNVAERRSAGYETFDGGQNCPADGQPKMAARDESGITNKGRPRSRPLSWTKRISQDFYNSADLAGKLKSVCSLPGAVSKDAGNMFISTSLTSAKAFASYWKPPKVTNEHRRVASINKGTSPRASVNWHSSSIDARSPSIDSTWSSSSSRKSSLSSHSSFDKYSIKLNRHSLKMDRDGKEKDPGVVTTYGIDEFGPPVVAKYLLDF